MAITQTSGGSGALALRATNASVTLFTTPADINGFTDNCFFIVYLTYTNGSGQVIEKQKIIVGPSTPVRIVDDTLSVYFNLTWHWVGMIIA
jgi:hypothetical protein